MKDCVCKIGYRFLSENETTTAPATENETTTDPAIDNGQRRQGSNVSNATSQSATVGTLVKMRKCVRASNLDPATAQAASEMVSTLVGTVVAANVAMAVGTAVAGSVGGAVGGATGGASGGGGSGGGCAALITQVQFLNVMGRIGGSNGSVGMSSFTEGLGWANFEFGLVGTSGGNSSRRVWHQRRAKSRTTDLLAKAECEQALKHKQEMSEKCKSLLDKSCTFGRILPSLEQCVTCFIILLAVAVSRALIVLGIEKGLHKEAPTGFMFPCWEGPVFLAQYLAICDSMFTAVSTGCSLHQSIGFTVLTMVPMLFFIVAAVRVKRHVKQGRLSFEPAPRPGLRTIWNTYSAEKGCFAKLMYLRKVFTDYQIKGEWNDDNKHARRWNFLVSNVTLTCWVYSLFLLLKKTALSLVLSTLEGRANAFFSLVIQALETGLLIWYRPHIELRTAFLEVVGGLTNLVAIAAIACPILFDIPLPDWMGDIFIMCMGMFATVSGAVASVFDFIAPVHNFLKTARKFCQNPVAMCGLASAGAAGGVGAALATEAYNNISGELIDEMEEDVLDEEHGHKENADANGDRELVAAGAVIGAGAAVAAVATVDAVAAAPATTWRHRLAAAAAASENMAPLALLTLALSCDLDVAGAEGSGERDAFERDLKQDVSLASQVYVPHLSSLQAPRGLPTVLLRVVHVTPNTSGVIVGLQVFSDAPVDWEASSSNVALDLENLLEQSYDPQSPLMKGTVTKYLKRLSMHSGAGEKMFSSAAPAERRFDWSSWRPSSTAELVVLHKTELAGSAFEKINADDVSLPNYSAHASNSFHNSFNSAEIVYGGGVPVFAYRNKHITMSVRPHSEQFESGQSEQAQNLVEELRQFYAKYHPSKMSSAGTVHLLVMLFGLCVVCHEDKPQILNTEPFLPSVMDAMMCHVLCALM